MQLAHLLCLAGRHKPHGRRIDLATMQYLATCRHCKVPLHEVSAKVWQRA